MIPSVRKRYNEEFSQEKYNRFLSDLEKTHPGQLDFRVAETPVFVPKNFIENILAACEKIIDVITTPGFKANTNESIPAGMKVRGEDSHPHFIAFDFGICQNENNELEPQLIEMQGFPSLFAYEVLLDETYRRNFNIPPGFEAYLGGLERTSYLRLLKEIILGDHNPEEVILLEIFPAKQKTRIDFYCTQEYTGINIVCLTQLLEEKGKLFYTQGGKKIQVKRIYNRVIFDELLRQEPEVREKGRLLFKDLDVEWCPHPQWFYRISKFTLPLIHHPYIPKTNYLSELDNIPADLENYVLKPLFSFAGQGVVIDVNPGDIEKINDPQNWILQRKVQYAEVIKTPDVMAKAEIRIFYFWKDRSSRPVPANNLARISKGKMIGVRYNKDKEWVGGSCCYFEQ